MKKLVLCLTVLIVSFVGLSPSYTTNNRYIKVSLIHFNDFHSKFVPLKEHFRDKKKTAGIARLIYLIKKYKKRNTIVLTAGDVLQGTIFSTIFKGEIALRLLNPYVDYMVIGNHEFDYGQRNLQRLMSKAKFKIFSSNIYRNNNTPYFKKTYYMRKINNLKIGIFGLTTTQTPVTTLPKNVYGLKFLDEIKTARRMVRQLKRMGANFIIALTHIGYKKDVVLAKSVRGIDVIIGGHSHSKLKKNIKIRNTLLTQAGSNGFYLGKINVVYDKVRKRIVRKENVYLRITPTTPEDRNTLRILKYYKSKLDKSLNRVIGRTLVPLDGRFKTVRSKESNLGNLIADVIKRTTRSEIAFINGGGIRASIPKGKITVRQIYSVLPFNNTISTMKLAGRDLLKILARSAAKDNGDGGFLQVSSGIKIMIKNKKLLSATFNNRRIIPGRYYKVAVSDFLASGGDNYREFKNGRNVIPTGLTFSDSVIKYIKRVKRVKILPEGRIKRIR